jgi:triosephosphate isomerase (TIM)
MERKPVLAGNWKMHATLGEARVLVRGLVERVGSRADREVLVAPPFTALAAVVEAARGSRIAVAAQNMHHEEKGAFTGEVSPLMLRDLGVTHVILGHSERRQLFGETDEVVRRKVESALNHDLIPTVCVGETLGERDAGETLTVVRRQVEAALRGLAAAAGDRAIVAYEPVWAIGTGRVATPEQAQEVHAEIRRSLAGLGLPAPKVRILYGGSVKADNVDGLMACADIDGALVGGASLEVEGFTRIVEFRA